MSRASRKIKVNHNLFSTFIGVRHNFNQPRSQGLSSEGEKMRDPRNKVELQPKSNIVKLFVNDNFLGVSKIIFLLLSLPLTSSNFI